MLFRSRTDGTVELWDAGADVPRVIIGAPGLGAATAVTFVDDHVAVGHARGGLRLHPATAAAALARGCTIAARFGRAQEAAAYCSGSIASPRR